MGDRLELLGVPGIPEIHAGDDLARVVARALRDSASELRHGDVAVIAQKVVSKAEGRIVDLRDVEPGERARAWAEEHGLEPRKVQVVLDESRRIVRMERGVLIAETRHGFVCANAGVDASNAPEGCVVLLPVDPDASAARLRAGLTAATGARVATVVTDTWGRPWRLGIVNFAIGASGLRVLRDHRGERDPAGRPLRSTLAAVADEVAAAAGLVMGKVSRLPVVVVRGLGPDLVAGGEGTARDLLRPPDEDLFR